MIKFLIVVFILIVGNIKAQQFITTVVKDAFNKQPVKAKIYSKNQLLVETDSAGFFSLQVFKEDTIFIKATSYETYIFKVDFKDLPSQIFLIPNNYYSNDIQITGILIGKNNLHTPKSISNLTVADINRVNSANPQGYFNLLPGVRMDSRSAIASGSKFVIRGVGSQYPNAAVGFKAYLDDIPITDADGINNIDDIDFERLGRVEFVRGPVGSMYGNAGAGGTVLMYNAKALRGNTFGQSYMSGADGLWKTNTYFGQGNNKSNVSINYSHQNYDGFRMHSGSKKDFINVNADIISDEKRSISFYIGYTKSQDRLAGQLDSINNLNRPDSADLAYILTDALNNVETGRMSITHEYKFSNKFFNRTSLFLVSQSFTQQIPLTLNKINKNKFGVRTVFTYTPNFGKKKARIVYGGEIIKNINYQKAYNSNATGVLSTLKTDVELKPITWNGFAELNLQIDKYVSATAGVSANYTIFDVTDYRLSSANPLYVNNTGVKKFNPALLPHVSVSRNFGNHDLYVSYNESNILPTTDQVFIQRLGRLNDTIQPEKVSSFELGLKGSLFKNSLNYQITLYTLEITDRIIFQNVAQVGAVPAFVFYLNNGGARSNGAEVALNYIYKPNSGTIDAIRFFGNYTYNHFKNADYKSDNNGTTATKDYSDLPVSGVAPNVINVGFDFLSTIGIYASGSVLSSDRMPINLAATSYSKGYTLANGRIGWRLNNSLKYKKQRWSIDVYCGMDNIFSVANPQMVFVNTVAAATNQLPKYFSPGNPNATFYSGLNVSFSF
jgi:iron complex outermembrane receptor protein